MTQREQMITHDTSTTFDLESIFLAQREPLIRFCTRITQRHDVAEDLVQETLIEAWRRVDALRDPQAIHAWIFGIARHVCLRWLRRQRGEQAHLYLPPDDIGPSAEIAADFDLDVELERDELATLLDRALALLPADARAILVQKYVEESPHAEIAQRLGLSEGAVAMRLQRGKLAFRRVLVTQLRDEAHAFGLVTDHDDTWTATRIWCPFCGCSPLLCQDDRVADRLVFRCADRCIGADGQIVLTTRERLIGGLRSHKAMLSRQLAYANTFYRRGIDLHQAECPLCTHAMQITTQLLSNVRPILNSLHGVRFSCSACGYTDTNQLYHLALDLPATQQFWRTHPRMRVLPERVVDLAGRPAVLITFESIRDSARLDILSDQMTLAIVDVSLTP
jgi:RNA polymerase sigma-70 factor (ECF subfamily)